MPGPPPQPRCPQICPDYDRARIPSAHTHRKVPHPSRLAPMADQGLAPARTSMRYNQLLRLRAINAVQPIEGDRSETSAETIRTTAGRAETSFTRWLTPHRPMDN